MKKPKYYLKPIDLQDYNFFYSTKEQKERYVVGYVLMKGNRRLAIGGFFGRDSAFVAFIKVVDQIPVKFFFKEVKEKFKQMAASASMPVYAIQDETIKNSRRFLEKLGFQYYTKSLDNEEIYKL